MTDSERRKYKNETKEWRDAFDRWGEIHPNWDFSQRAMMATLETRGVGGGPGTLETVLRRTRDYLQVNFPETFFKVARTLDSIITLVKNKVLNAWNQIIEWFNSL